MANKTSLSISINAEVLELAKLKYPDKLSSMIEDFLKSMLDIKDELTKDINYNDEKSKIAIQISELKLKLEQLDIQKKHEIKRQMEQAENQKKHEIERKKCIQCNQYIYGKSYDFTKGTVCMACYFVGTKQHLKNWRA